MSPSPKLDKKGVEHVIEIVGALFFYEIAVNNKVRVALNLISTQQVSVTEATNKAVTTLLDYMATYPNDGILYHAVTWFWSSILTQAFTMKLRAAAEWRHTFF